MLLKDIKPNTEYADCNGNLIVTGDSVENLYHWSPKGDGVLHSSSVKPLHPDLKENKRLLGLLEAQQAGKKAAKKDVGKPDPWDRCTTRGRPSKRGNLLVEGAYGYKFWQYGILVHLYEHDRNGKRAKLSSSIPEVVTPKNIPGTWADYCILHADELMLPFVQKEIGDQARALAKTARFRAIQAGVWSLDDPNLSYKVRPAKATESGDDLEVFSGAYIEMLAYISAPNPNAVDNAPHWFGIWGHHSKADPKRTVIVPKVVLTGRAAQDYIDTLAPGGYEAPTDDEIDKMTLAEVRTWLARYDAKLPRKPEYRKILGARSYLKRVVQSPAAHRGEWKGL